MKRVKRAKTVRRVEKANPLVRFLEKWGFLVAIVAAGLVMIPILNNHFRVLGARVTVGGSTCTTIQSGTLLASDESVIETGYDKWGYNYQALMFNGKYCDAYRDAVWCQPYKEDNLLMKWNDAWLSNKDCDGDRLLDRHYGFSSYQGSSAWLTNHQSGTYPQGGKECKWTYFVKIVAAPADATLEGGVWKNSEGTEIGDAIWGEFAVIEEINNDPCEGYHGKSFVSPAGAGLGVYKP